jgi:hypothetical protein
MALGIVLRVIGQRAPRVLAAIALPVWTACSLLGLLMLFIWFGTAHRAGWANQNLLLFDPLCLALLPGGWRMLRGRAPGAWFERWLAIVAGCAVAAWIMRWLPFPEQDNTHWIALLLPLHVALLSGLRARSAAGR